MKTNEKNNVLENSSITVFTVIFIVFYMPVILRTTTLSGNTVFGNSAKPFYFAGLSHSEKKIWNKYQTTEKRGRGSQDRDHRCTQKPLYRKRSRTLNLEKSHSIFECDFSFSIHLIQIL